MQRILICKSSSRQVIVLAVVMLWSTPLHSTEPAGAVVPDRLIQLFNGTDLKGWTSWLVDIRNQDPRSVYTVRDGSIYISGDGYGYLSTSHAYRNYELVVEVKWGEHNRGNRIGKARDSGIFLHSAGPDGGSYDRGWGAPDSNNGPDPTRGAYKAAIECQVMEGSFGGLLLIHGRYADGTNVPVRITVPVSRNTNFPNSPRLYFDPKGEHRQFTKGWVHWQKRDPTWQDLLGFRGSNDVESSCGEWTRIKCVCRANTITIFVNGKLVNRATNVFPDFGNILLQCEGSEVYYRKVELRPLD